MPTTFDWDSMQSFLAIARAGRLTVAAQRLGIDHHLSRRIKELGRCKRDCSIVASAAMC